MSVKNIDITGQKFNKLIAIRKDVHSLDEHVRWIFKCECSTVKSIRKSCVTRGQIQSCGCIKGPKQKDITGLVFNYFTALYKDPIRPKEDRWNRNYWVFRCICGTECVLLKSQVVGGMVKSCGCKYLITRFNNNKSKIFNELYSNYRSSAQNRNLDFNLTCDEFEELILQSCFYCGKPPSNIRQNKDSSFLYSGLDRVDNSNGYNSNNVVPCCITCNKFKLNMSLEDFTNHLINICQVHLKDIIQIKDLSEIHPNKVAFTKETHQNKMQFTKQTQQLRVQKMRQSSTSNKKPAPKKG